MRIDSLTLTPLRIPFRESFSHHTADRHETESVLVTAVSANGLRGYGEGCPRSYVTGESVASASEFFAEIEKTCSAVSTLQELSQVRNSIRPSIEKNPSAWCAVESALLDLLARENGQSVEDLLRLPPPPEQIHFTAVIGISKPWKFVKRAALYRALGFRDFKIKLSGNSAQDRQALLALRALGVSPRKIRVDANNLWSTSKDALQALNPLRNLFWAIEEPLKPFDFHSMREIANALNVRIILDESFLGTSQLEAIAEGSYFYLPNLRVSKLGGLQNTVEIMQGLKERGFRFILGSHVGETSLLTRTALASVGRFQSEILAYEGGFGDHFLKQDPFTPPLKFGWAGRLRLTNSSLTPGWGMSFTSGENS